MLKLMQENVLTFPEKLYLEYINVIVGFLGV